MSMSTQKAINYVEKDKKDYSERKQQVDCLIEISEEALEKTFQFLICRRSLVVFQIMRRFLNILKPRPEHVE